MAQVGETETTIVMREDREKREKRQGRMNDEEDRSQSNSEK
jgi:hypothetical protein